MGDRVTAFGKTLVCLLLADSGIIRIQAPIRTRTRREAVARANFYRSTDPLTNLATSSVVGEIYSKQGEFQL